MTMSQQVFLPCFYFFSKTFLVILTSMIVFSILKRESLSVYFEIKKTNVFPYCLLGEGGGLHIDIIKLVISEKVLGTGNVYGQSV